MNVCSWYTSSKLGLFLRKTDVGMYDLVVYFICIFAAILLMKIRCLYSLYFRAQVPVGSFCVCICMCLSVCMCRAVCACFHRLVSLVSKLSHLTSLHPARRHGATTPCATCYSFEQSMRTSNTCISLANTYMSRTKTGIFLAD